jgi:hypothetical protein
VEAGRAEGLGTDDHSVIPWEVKGVWVVEMDTIPLLVPVEEVLVWDRPGDVDLDTIDDHKLVVGDVLEVVLDNAGTVVLGQ